MLLLVYVARRRYLRKDSNLNSHGYGSAQRKNQKCRIQSGCYFVDARDEGMKGNF